MMEEVRQRLIAQLKAQEEVTGLWNGRLSSSAVSTAIAAFALLGRGEEGPCLKAAQWLVEHVNADGGWGDTPASPSNMTASLIVCSTLFALRNQFESTAVRERAKAWLCEHLGNDDFIAGILQYYGKDLTFSAPLLSMCTLSGMLGEDAWVRIPRLPFSLAVLPRSLFTVINIGVVSYALPALIAVGLLQYRKAGSDTPWTEGLIIPRVLKKLEAMLPASGGYLEAAPLTGFVSMCLSAAGHEQHPVACATREFLTHNQREDGSWPIDTNLSTWLSSLAIKALVENHALDDAEKARYRAALLARQSREAHPFTETAAGGWAWTDLPGGVPDADDTAAALLALALLDCPYNEQIEAGLQWLLRLQNRDGGMPTFCKGWGFLPFDRSCPDITAHALRAFASWQGQCPDLGKAMSRMLHYLQKHQDAEGAWSPLWFGAQDVVDKRNRVYGTAVVLEHLHVLQGMDKQDFIQKGLDYLLQAQNEDGLWGGDKSSQSNIECSAKAIAALAAYPQTRALAQAALKQLPLSEKLPASPIGLYFASLWYDEELYPLLFTLLALKNHSL